MYACPLHLNLRPSAQLLAFVAAAHAMALVAVVWSASNEPWSLLLAGPVLASAWHYAWRHAALRSSSSVVRLEWDCDDRWRLFTLGGEVRDGRLRADTYLHPYLIILNFKGRLLRRTSVVIAPDRLDAESFRRLYVRLKISGGRERATGSTRL